MSEETKGMRPIWYFVGLILVIMGAVIFLTGIYNLYYPLESETVLSELHPNIWWGLIMAAAGGILLWISKGVTVE